MILDFLQVTVQDEIRRREQQLSETQIYCQQLESQLQEKLLSVATQMEKIHDLSEQIQDDGNTDIFSRLPLCVLWLSGASYAGGVFQYVSRIGMWV